MTILNYTWNEFKNRATLYGNQVYFYISGDFLIAVSFFILNDELFVFRAAIHNIVGDPDLTEWNDSWASGAIQKDNLDSCINAAESEQGNAPLLEELIYPELDSLSGTMQITMESSDYIALKTYLNTNSLWGIAIMENVAGANIVPVFFSDGSESIYFIHLNDVVVSNGDEINVIGIGTTYTVTFGSDGQNVNLPTNGNIMLGLISTYPDINPILANIDIGDVIKDSSGVYAGEVFAKFLYNGISYIFFNETTGSRDYPNSCIFYVEGASNVRIPYDTLTIIQNGVV